MIPTEAMIPTGGGWRRVSLLAGAGGLAFWTANLAISLTPVAADYRAALSIAYLPMLAEALFGGLIIGFGVSYCLLRFFDEIPARGPLLKSLLLSGIGFAAVTILIEVPAKFLAPTNDALRYFLIGAAINGVRILALGAVIGLLGGRLSGRRSDRPSDRRSGRPRGQAPSSGTR